VKLKNLLRAQNASLNEDTYPDFLRCRSTTAVWSAGLASRAGAYLRPGEKRAIAKCGLPMEQNEKKFPVNQLLARLYQSM